MPELPEVETVCLALSKIINYSKVRKIKVFRKDLRWEIRKKFITDLQEDVLIKPYRRGKYILISTLKQKILLIHLGMSGQVKISSNKYNRAKHDHLIINIESKYNKIYSLIYNDPRRFGFIDLFKLKEVEHHFLLKKLGVDPLGNEFNVDYLKKKISNRSKCIKSILMDQTIIAGLGNIYASEILYKAKINPLRSADSLNLKHLKSIITSTKFTLKQSISMGGTSIKDHLQPDGKLGYFVQKLQVYGKKNQNCNNCNNLISMIFINNRSTYFCSNCQK